jgi:hypothetical protein
MSSINLKRKLISEINDIEIKLKKINCTNNSIYDENCEIPISSVYNLITLKNFQMQKSKIFTKKLIKKLKSRKLKKSNIILKEIFEEIEIPYLNYE